MMVPEGGGGGGGGGIVKEEEDIRAKYNIRCIVVTRHLHPLLFGSNHFHICPQTDMTKW